MIGGGLVVEVLIRRTEASVESVVVAVGVGLVVVLVVVR
jgi:hypothetical protein